MVFDTLPDPSLKNFELKFFFQIFQEMLKKGFQLNRNTERLGGTSSRRLPRNHCFNLFVVPWGGHGVVRAAAAKAAATSKDCTRMHFAIRSSFHLCTLPHALR